MTNRTFAGKFNLDGIYSWMNPAIPKEERYSRQRLLSDFVEIDQETFDHFLDMMPPVNFSSTGFAICEPLTHDIRLGFFQVHGRYFAAYISDTDKAHDMAATRDLIATAAPEAAHGR